jgi:CRP/FNR family transcriptional regulator, cyclic AMP receptor protein
VTGATSRVRHLAHGGSVPAVAGTFLEALDDVARADLARRGRMRRFESGAALFLEGDVGASVVIVHTGHVKVFATSAEGHERVLAIRGPGEVLGDLSAVDGQPRSASGVALGPVDAHVVTADDFRAFLAETAGAALALLQVTIGRVRDSDRLRIEFGALDACGRVATRLVELAETVGEPVEGGVRLRLPLTQDDLAGWISASREAVARALASLRKRGLITTGRREITILDVAGLRDAAR